MRANLRLRPAERADVSAIVALLREDALGQTRETHPDDPRYLAAYEAMAADPNNRLYVLDRAGIVLGCAQLTIIPGLARKGATRAIIEAVRVSADERGAGLGTFLIEELVGIAAACGCALVQLTSDKSRTDAHRFYRRLGFTASHEGFKKALPENAR